MNRKQKIIVSITGIFLVLMILVGLTYAYFLTKITGNTNTKSISVTTANLQVKYVEGNDVIEPTEKILPGFTATKTFSVTNEGNKATNYSVIFDSVSNSFTRTQDWTYELKKNDEVVKTGTITNEKVQPILYSETIEVNVTDNYSLTVTYNDVNENQSEDMNKTLILRINIANEYTNSWDTPITGTLLSSIKTSNTVETDTTKSGLFATDDDYGTSYYFRGAPTNNYVNFSGMCWRILRVEGNGIIRLILADENKTCENTTSTSIEEGIIHNPSNTSEKALFAYTNEQVLTDYDSSTNVFTYLIDNASNYEKSLVPNVLNAWSDGMSVTFVDGREIQSEYEFAKKIQKSILTETFWCNDISLNNRETGDWGGMMNYNSATRIKNKNPSLKCDFAGIENTKSLKYKSNIGIITADEYLFTDNSGTNFLKYNVGNDNYRILSMTPNYAYTGSGYPYMYGADSNINDPNYNTLYSMNYIIPIIAVKPTVSILSNTTGTQSNPYVIS